MSRARWMLALVAVLAAGACSDEPTAGPGAYLATPGTLLLRLTTPHTDDGALTFELSGPPIDSALAADAALILFTRRVNDTTVVGAVVGALATGAVIRLQVPDVAAAAGFSARVLEVADRTDGLRASLTGYALTVAP